jgi:subtilisin family serine protease
MTIRQWNRTAVALLTTLGLGCSDRLPTTPERGTSPDASLSSASGNQPLPHLVVLRREGKPSSGLLAAVAKLRGRVKRSHDAIGVVTVGGLSDAAAVALAANPEVEGISRDVRIQWLPALEKLGRSRPSGMLPLSDQRGATFMSKGWQWNIGQINADDAWLVSPQGNGALVCILDTGIDPNHVDLAGMVDLGKSASFIAAEPSLNDLHGHGTFVAAIVAADGIHMASVAPDARLCAAKVLDQTGEGTFDEIIAGIVHAAMVRADVINMSFGALLLRSDPQARVLISAAQRAVRFAIRQGALVVAAAGNDGLNLDESASMMIPAQLSGVLSVGATGPLDQANFDRLASYTNFGKHSVHLMAPGGEYPSVSGNILDGLISACSSFITSFDCSSGSDYLFGGAGTSFAAPHVAGAAAVVESMLPGDQNGSQLETCLFLGADQPDGQVLSPLYGRGRLNVLQSVGSPGCGQGVVVNPTMQLDFVVQPTRTVANGPIMPAVEVAVQRTSDGSVYTSFRGSITLSIGLNAAGGTLVGTTSQPVVDGVATFYDLRLDQPGAAYTLRATASAQGPTPGVATSASFDIAPEGATATTGSMSVASRDHQAFLLNDGQVLLVGGTGGAAHLYASTTGTFTNLGPVGHGQGVSGAKLADGRVLIVGGGPGPIVAHLFDPATNTFRPTAAPPNVALNFRTATLLADGRVLLAAGQEEGPTGPQSRAFAEIFDPTDESFSPVGSLNVDRSAHAATLLRDGRVLIVGGIRTTTPGSGNALSSAELFDPATRTFSMTGSMAEGRDALYFTGITLLNDGRVLALGWSSSGAELYDPVSGTFKATGSMATAHSAGTATLLQDGRVLVAGGAVSVGPVVTAAVELYDPIGGTFTSATPLSVQRQQHSATRLIDGRVLIAGGFGGGIDADLKSAELYQVVIPPVPPIP